MKMGSKQKKDDTDNYFRGLTSAVGHLLGLHEDRQGNFKATCFMEDEKEKDASCLVSIENVNVVAPLQWEAGALLKTVKELNVFPPATIKNIQERIDKARKEELKPLCSQEVKDEQNQFAFSEGHSVSSPPHPAPSSSKKTVPTFHKVPNYVQSELQLQATKQFTFGSGKPIERYHVQPQNTDSPLSNLPPPAKRPTFGLSKNFSTHASGYTKASNPSKITTNTSKNYDDSQTRGLGTSFSTARELIQFEKKGAQQSLPTPPAGGRKRTFGLRKPTQKLQPEKITTTRASDNENNDSENPVLQPLMEKDIMKNMDSEILKVIFNEVIDIQQNTWNDIGGLHAVKQILRENLIWPMQRPEIFNGIRTSSRRILFFGPSEYPKSLFCRIIATECRSTLFNISASSFTTKWSMEGDKMVRALFAVARLKQPSVVFIDEIESILNQRSVIPKHESWRKMKNEFLVQFDGCVSSSEDHIIVIGGTNRPQDLDEVARRLFDKRIYIPLPDFESRKQLAKRLVQREAFEMTEDDFVRVARKTEGFSEDDMVNLAKEAALIPLRESGSNIRNINVEHIRSMTFRDFKLAMKQVKSSVTAADLRIYEEWDIQFGCHAGLVSNSEAEDTDDDN